MARAKDPLAPQPGPTPGRRDSADIVDAIVGAALDLGDPDASVNAIAARAGVGVASLYRYFPSKGAIYAEVSRRLQRDFLTRLRAALDAPSTSLEATVMACCRIAVEAPGASPKLRRSLNLSLPHSWVQESANAIFSATVTELTRWLETRITPAPADLRDRVFVAFAAGRGLVMMSRLLPELAPADDVLVAQMARGAMTYLQPLTQTV